MERPMADPTSSVAMQTSAFSRMKSFGGFHSFPHQGSLINIYHRLCTRSTPQQPSHPRAPSSAPCILALDTAARTGLAQGSGAGRRGDRTGRRYGGSLGQVHWMSVKRREACQIWQG